MVAQRDMTRHYTVEEWRALSETSDIKYEYRDGTIVAMDGGTADHAQIGFNTQAALAQVLEGNALPGV